MSRKIAKIYANIFNECSSCSEFVEKHDEYFAEAIKIGLIEAKKDLMSVGIFDIDEIALYEYMDGVGYLNEYKKLTMNFWTLLTEFMKI